MTARKRRSSQSFEIRSSTAEDLPAIKNWLSAESVSDPFNSLFGNWGEIENHHQSGSLVVCLEPKQKQPIAFLAIASINPEILEVHKEWRKTGIGKLLVTHCIKEALQKNQPILVIQCCPLSSIPFWKKMGFKVWTAANHLTYGRLLIEPKHRLPKAHPTVRVRFVVRYTNDWHQTIMRRKAALLVSGIIKLEKRVALSDPRSPYFETPFLEIFAGRTMIFKGKATSPQAIQLGVERCENGFFIDKLHPKKD